MRTLSYSDMFCVIYKWLNFELITNSFVWDKFVSCKEPIRDRGSIRTLSGMHKFQLEFQYEDSTQFRISLDRYINDVETIFFRDVYNYPYDRLPVVEIKDEKFCIKNESEISARYGQEGLFFISSLVNKLNAEVVKKNNRELEEQKEEEFQVTDEFLFDTFKQLYEIVNNSVQSVLPKDFLNQDSDKTYHQDTYCLTNYCLWVRYEETEEYAIHNYSGVGIKLFLENKKIIIFKENEIFPVITIRFLDDYNARVTISFDRTLEYFSEPFNEDFFEEIYQNCDKLLKSL